MTTDDGHSPNKAVQDLPQDIDNYITGRLDEALPIEARSILFSMARIAWEHKWPIYLVGGYVRDCLLKVPDYDIDISVEGDAPLLAQKVARETGAQLVTHPGFGTAILAFPGNLYDIDVVTARHERYERPGALPTVAAGTIEDDLARRDFTTNAMAVEILQSGFGPLLDPHSGIADLRSGLIRVLHTGSFIDDPTRIFRAVKLAKRLQFKIELGTLELILQAVRDNAINTLSIARITHELLLIMKEPKGGEMLAELDRLGVLAAIHPLLAWPYPDGKMGPPPDATLTPDERRDTYLAVLAAEFASDPDEAEGIARWLRLPMPQIKLMRDAARLAQLWPELGADNRRPSETYAILHDLDIAALQAYTRIKPLAQDTIPWSRLHDYLNRLLNIKPILAGDYLRQQGIPPGPIYKHALKALHNAKLDGDLPEREDEIRFLEDWLARHQS